MDGLGVSFIGHVIAWFHMQGQFRYEWAKTWWFVALGGVPISFIFWYGTKWYYEYFGNYWYVRPVGFGMDYYSVWIINLVDIKRSTRYENINKFGIISCYYTDTIITLICKVRYDNKDIKRIKECSRPELLG